MEGYTSLDIKEVMRGHCNFENTCACDGYTRAVDAGPQDASASFKSSLCAYCGHSPAHHASLGDRKFGVTTELQGAASSSSRSGAHTLQEVQNQPQKTTLQDTEMCDECLHDKAR
ncbi:hypothetical protein MTO96_047782 [Rhipicephalus appendiculatus]